MAEKPKRRRRPKVKFLTQRHYAGIGHVAESWSAVETLIDHCCWELADLSREVGACFTAQVIGPMRKIDALVALARLSGASKRVMKKLNAFAERTRTLGERRNRVVHDVWFRGEDDMPRHYEITARRAVRVEYVPMPTEEIYDLLREIDAHFSELGKLRDNDLKALRARVPRESEE